MSASSLLNGQAVNLATGVVAQLDSGIVNGADVRTGTIALSGGTATVTLGSGFLTGVSQIVAFPAGSATNANGGTYTCALVAPVAPAGYVAFTVTSSAPSDAGTVRWILFS
jgi:hypothetical protein